LAYLLDTNVVWRRFDKTDPRYPDIKQAVDNVLAASDQLYITAQNLVEFRALATRPIAANGLGYAPADAAIRSRAIERLFPLLQETPAIYPLWRTLVDTYGVVGRQVFDARLVAVMQAHGISHLLTLDSTDFKRYSAITVLQPSDLI